MNSRRPMSSTRLLPNSGLGASNNYQPVDGPSPAGRNYVEGGGTNGGSRCTRLILSAGRA